MPGPISEHTVPRPEADAARYVAEGYWAGIPIGRLLRQVADRSAGARAARVRSAQGHEIPARKVNLHAIW
jgi:2,3-dihydroxybenzoate-AMP ligase